MLDKLKESLKDCPIVEFGEYRYFVHPITDGIPLGDPELLEEVVEEMMRIGNLECDKIATAEAMGFPIAAALSLRTKIPYVFFRKKSYGLPGEVSVQQVTGYSKSKIFINNIKKNDRIVFVDDVISTGGTLKAIIKALQSIGAVIVDIIIVFEKIGAREKLEKELGMNIKTLLKVEVVDNKVEIR